MSLARLSEPATAPPIRMAVSNGTKASRSIKIGVPSIQLPRTRRKHSATLGGT